MIYTPMTKKAMKLAYRAHEGQYDKSGIPYVFHPLHVAEQMTDEVTTTVALLHDTMEDSFVTPEVLRREGFPDEVIEAVRVLTKDRAIPYLDYVRRVKENPAARIVKIADLRHNLDFTRLDVIDESALAHRRKYLAALEILRDGEDRP